MSALTPEAARAAAEWLDNNLTGSAIAAATLACYADRKEAEDRPPGQVAMEAYDKSHDGSRWVDAAAAVIAHHVGPDRVVVDRDDLVETLRWTGGASFASDINKASTRLREALS